MVEFMLARLTVLHNWRGGARTLIVFFSLPGPGGCAAAGILCWISEECASLGLRLSKKLPARLLPLPLLSVSTSPGTSPEQMDGKLYYSRRSFLSKLIHRERSHN